VDPVIGMEEHPVPVAQLPAVRKASIVLISLGQELSANVLKHLSRDEIETLTLEIARIKHVSPDLRDAVLAEFSQMIVAQECIIEGGIEYAQGVLQQALGKETASEIISRLVTMLQVQPFDSVKSVDPTQLLQLLQNEHPQTIALVLAHLPPETSAMVLSGLPQKLQAQVAMRIVGMDRASPEVVREVEGILQARITATGTQDFDKAGGPSTLADILNCADRTTERSILDDLMENNPEVAEEVKKRLFVFEDIITLGRRDIQLVLREVDGKDLALALKGAPENVRSVIYENMSERAAQSLREEMEFMGAVRLRDVEAAQQKIVSVIRALEEAGEVVISRGEENETII